MIRQHLAALALPVAAVLCVAAWAIGPTSAVAARSVPSAPVVKGPRVSSSTAVTYRFTAHERGVAPRRLTFRCALDRGSFKHCAAVFRLRLTVGNHLLRVRAVDPAGRVGPPTGVTVRIVAAAERPAAVVRVGLQPVNDTFGAGSIWASNFGDGTVSRVDPATAKVVATVSVGGSPGGLTFGDGSIWVANFGDGSVERIDPQTNAVARIVTGGRPEGVTVGTDGAVWVSDYGSGALLRIDADTNGIVQRVAVGGTPEVAAFAGSLLWSTNGDGTVTPIDPMSGTVAGARISIATDVDAIAVSPEGVWVSTFYSGTVALIDPATGSVVRKFALPGQASGLTFRGAALWASVYNRAHVVELDPTSGKITRTFAVGAKPRDLAFDGSSLWVVSEAANTISKIGG